MFYNILVFIIVYLNLYFIGLLNVNLILKHKYLDNVTNTDLKMFNNINKWINLKNFPVLVHHKTSD